MNDFTSESCNLGFIKDEEQEQTLYRVSNNFFKTFQIFYLEMIANNSQTNRVQFIDL